MYEGPFSMRSNQDCILCGNCIKICADKAPKLNLRVPGYELWSFLRPEKSVVVLLPIIITTQLFRGLEVTPLFHQWEGLFNHHLLSLSLCLVAMILLSYLFINVAAPAAFSRLEDQEMRKVDLFIYSLVPLCFTFELSYHLKPFLTRAGLILPVLGKQLGFNWDVLGVSAGPGFVAALQVLFVLVGFCTTRLVHKKLGMKHEHRYKTRRSMHSGWPFLCLAALYIYFFAAG